MNQKRDDCSGKQLLSNAKRCCLVSIKEDTKETEELCRTLDIGVVERVIQNRNSAHPHTFIGSGKLDELKEMMEKVDIFVFDGELKPSQHFRLETTLKRICADRIALVLEIFERHAKSNEAKSQVALARIRHELPFIREWVSKGTSGDRPGFLSGGEYTIDAYYENARKQMKRIETELTKISAGRELRRSRRRDQGFYLVSICGYTNGGKSTLLTTLSGAATTVDDKMFSTLSTTTRLLSGSGKKVLVTDTVGFIRNLPPDLFDAFDATMEEIYESDCAVLVLDFSDPVDSIIEKLQTSLKILIPHVERSNIIIALNKIDRLSVEELQNKINSIESSIFGYTFYLISAQDRIGIENLIKGILNKIGVTLQVGLTLPLDERGRKIYQWAAEHFVIVNADWNNKIDLTLQVNEEEVEIIARRVEKLVDARLRRPDKGSI
jgi:GTP-binding protein HflX